MISLICYWWISMWGVNFQKEGFAYMSTFELAFELIVFVAFFPAIYELIRGK